MFRLKIAKAVKMICEGAIKASTKEACWDWLYVLPLYHFTSELSKPFMDLQYDFESIQFDATAKEVDLFFAKMKIPDGYGHNIA